MKGLTPREFELLRGLAHVDSCDGSANHRVASADERAEFDSMVEQGRIALAACPCCPTRTYQITAAGRQAISLWERFRRFFGGAS